LLFGQSQIIQKHFNHPLIFAYPLINKNNPIEKASSPYYTIDIGIDYAVSMSSLKQS
jgi:hypothetical protein